MTELKLEVGKTYISGDGDKVYIKTEHKDERLYKFVSGTGITYQINGREIANEEYSGNLIAEYTPPAAPAQPATRTPHKWAAEMHAFADGHAVESKPYGSRHWDHAPCPSWSEYNEYRIKPEPEPAPLKPHEVKFIALERVGMSNFIQTEDKLIEYGCKKAVRIEFNPNTQELVSAEVVTL